jgi:aminoglycoside phosphotransferase (APT) family kinase protein
MEGSFMGGNGASGHSTPPGTTPLRHSRRDHAQLRTQLDAWLAQRLPELGPLQVSAITTPGSSGVANETLLLETQHGDGRGPDLVLRLEGEEFLYPEADLALHYEMFERVGAIGTVPVPEMLAFEEDTTVLGTRFMLMRRVVGRSVPDRPNFNYAGWLHDLSKQEQQAVWHEAVLAMSQIHALNPKDFAGLLARSEGVGLTACFEYWRRFARWCGGDAVALIRAADDWLETNLPRPETLHECISWGDARLQNLMFEGTRCTALLDWDMVSLAGAEADLAWWAIADHKYTASRGMPRLPGIKSPQATIALWESLTGRKAKHMEWHLVFAAFRQALISIRLSQLADQVNETRAEPPEPSVGLQWLACLLDLPLGQPVTLPFVGLDR